ncbi:MAG: Mut7-C RNAse domain-containing protein [Candidatus Scalinduaceae bacterium]
MSSEPLKFMADSMLGRLARWLRILGYDVVYESSITDDDLIARALQERRIILTMDRELSQRESARNCLFIKSDDYREQLKHVIAYYDIDCKSRIFTRCLLCNVKLDSVEKKRIKDKVPPYVYSIQDEFDICPQCHRVYWSGTHRDKILKKLNEILGTFS